MSSFEVYLDIRQPAPEAAKPSAGSGVCGVPLRRAVTGQHGGAAAGRFYSFATVLYSAPAAAAVADGSAAAALRVVHGGHEPNVVLLYRLARHSPGAQRRAARIAAAANAATVSRGKPRSKA